MTQILNVHAFLEHSFPRNENLIPDSMERELIQQYIRIPYHNIPIHRDAMTGQVVNPDVNFKRSCATATYCGINITNTEVEPTVMKSVHEISKQALCSTKTGFTPQNCVLKSANYSMELPSIPSIIDELLKMASEDVVQNWCFPKGYFLRSTAQINEAGTFLLPKRETITFLKRRVRTKKPYESYAVIEDTTTPLPTLTKLIENPALNWNFELDTFQKRAILCLENNQTVFVAAHTSSGKTVIAEYACAVCLRRGSRVIYTSPVKALSNQKFYDFRERFGGDVGLITGDIKVAPDAQLLIMTTEILHNMLCNESELIKDLEIVILDEVHYINDPDRGYVWEQIMIMLPKHILLVMLSATVPNNFELADWLGRVRGCEVRVIVTDKRPISLEHYLFTGTDGQYAGHLHLIVDKNNCFVDSGYRTAAEANASRKLLHRPFPCVRGKEAFLMTVKNTWLGFVHLLKERDLLPVIAFSFSRSSLETLAKSLSSVDLTSTNEKQLINKFFSLTTSCLRKCDRKLASVRFIRDLTKRGLAVHHAGMLPVLKETVELLFRMGLVKILFATETFSTGVNMPARCVVFTSIDKFDGQMIRPLSSSEYTQMAGRAGRRGLDAKGYVIILVSSIGRSLKSSVTGLPTENVLRSVILGTQTRLVSQFKVTYSMILNLHRSSSLTPRDVMKRSFMEAASHRWETEQRQRLSFLNKKLDETTTPISSNKSSNDFNQTSAINSVSAFAENSDDLFESLFVYLDVRVNCPYNGIECCDSISAYYQLCYRYRQLTQSLICTLSTKYERYLQNIFCPGRVILLQVTMKQSVWLVPGVIINYYWKTKKKDGKDQLLFHAILWKLPTNLLDSSTFVNKKQEEESETLAIVGSNNKISTAPVDEDKHSWFNCEYDEIEEKILRNIEDSCDTQWTETPVPPHLVPVFMPSSLEDGYARLTLQSILPDDSLFRICDRIVTFENKSNLNDDGSLKSNMNISDRLFHSIKQHQTVVTLRKTSSNLLDDNNEHYFSILNDVNLALFNSVNPPQHNSSFHVIYKTLSDNVPKQVDIIKELKADKIDEEDVRLFDEYSTISDQLTNPLSISDTTTLTSNLLKCPNLLQHLNRFHQTIRRKLTIKRIESNLADYQLQLSKEYTGRLNVLKELGFIDSATQSYCLSFKGFFACELTKKEVVLTQLLLDGFIDNLLAPEIAAVLSVFANEIRTYDFSAEKKSSIYLKELVNSIDCINSTTNYVCNNDLDLIPRHLLPVFKRILICAYKLETLQRFHNLSDPYLECRFDLRLVPLVYKWAKGYSFSATIAKCDLPEGLLVKSLLQLDELIRHIIGACRQFGKHVLGLKMCEAKNLIYRDIVCSPSLYVLKGIKSAKDD